jgi:hypothetical protein
MNEVLLRAAVVDENGSGDSRRIEAAEVDVEGTQASAGSARPRSGVGVRRGCGLTTTTDQYPP